MPRTLRVVFFGELASTFSRLHYSALRDACEVLLWVAGPAGGTRDGARRAAFSSLRDWRRRAAERLILEARAVWSLRVLPWRHQVRCPVHRARAGEGTLAQHLAGLSPDLIISAGFNRIVAPPVLEIPRIGAFNCHPSPLPRYAGRDPWFWMLRNGESETAITIHRMVTEPDAGDVVAQEWFAVPARANHQWLYNRSALVGAALMKRCVVPWATRGLPETPQDLAARSWFGTPGDQDYHLDWTRPAAELLNLVRAAQPAPGAWTLIDGQRAIVQDADLSGSASARPGEVLKSDRSGVVVACGAGSIRIRRMRFGHRELGARGIERALMTRHGAVIGG
jgi:methionyl-tRNA formyltransferase